MWRAWGARAAPRTARCIIPSRLVSRGRGKGGGTAMVGAGVEGCGEVLSGGGDRGASRRVTRGNGGAGGSGGCEGAASHDDGGDAGGSWCNLKMKAAPRWLVTANSVTSRSWERGVRGAGTSRIGVSASQGSGGGKRGRGRAAAKTETVTSAGGCGLRVPNRRVPTVPSVPMCIGEFGSVPTNFVVPIYVGVTLALLALLSLPLFACAAVTRFCVPNCAGFVIAFLVFERPPSALWSVLIAAAQAHHAVARGERCVAKDSAGAESADSGAVHAQGNRVGSRAIARGEGGQRANML